MPLRLEEERLQDLCASGEVMGASMFVSGNTSSVRGFQGNLSLMWTKDSLTSITAPWCSVKALSRPTEIESAG